MGDRVAHDQYGLGKVVDIQDKGHNSVLTVDFGSEGTKRLMLRLAPIEKLWTLETSEAVCSRLLRGQPFHGELGPVGQVGLGQDG